MLCAQLNLLCSNMDYSALVNQKKKLLLQLKNHEKHRNAAKTPAQRNFYQSGVNITRKKINNLNSQLKTFTLVIQVPEEYVPGKNLRRAILMKETLKYLPHLNPTQKTALKRATWNTEAILISNRSVGKLPAKVGSPYPKVKIEQKGRFTVVTN